MSDDEDDFMSDKFLVEAAAPVKTYSQQRDAQKLKSLRAGQAKNLPTLAVLEKERRHAGLNTSLFDTAASQNGGSSGGENGAGPSTGRDKAMAMMAKMGWKAGEGLGKRRSPSPPSSSKRARLDDGDEEEEAPKAGLGGRRPMSNMAKIAMGRGSEPTRGGGGRVEPVRISMWAGRKGLSSRQESPPPLPNTSGRNVDYLDPRKMKRLEGETEDYREFQKRSFGDRETMKKEERARELLMGFDQAQGIKFHPLHILPSDPLSTLPNPLLKRIYPASYHSPLPPPPTDPPAPARSHSPSPPLAAAPTRQVYVSEAEKLRDQMRRDMLSAMGRGEDEEDEVGPLSLGVKAPPEKRKREEEEEGAIDPMELEEGDVDWDELVAGAKRVLSMDAETHLQFLLDQLRHEHKFCFWCSFKYKSFEEMDGPGGCPGEEEDDH